jgi:hypothetical protein
VRADGRNWLFYEVHVTNWSDEDMTLLRLEVLMGDQTAVFEGETLKRLTMGHQTSLAPGVRTAVLVVMGNSETFPGVIRHRLTVSQPSRPSPTSIECARWSISSPDALLRNMDYSNRWPAAVAHPLISSWPFVS